MLLNVTEELHEDDGRDPYSDCDGPQLGAPLLANKTGFTAAAVSQLCRELGVPIHIKWGGCKIESYTREKSEYDA